MIGKGKSKLCKDCCRSVTGSKVYNWLSQLFWVLVILLCVAGCLYFCTGRIKNLLKKPTTTAITIDRQLEIKFPAVTICNLNVLRKDYLQRIGLDGFFRQSSFLNYQNSNETSSCLAHLENATNPHFTNLTYQSLLENGIDGLSDMITDCEFQGNPCEVNSSYFVPSMTRFGICYTFNSGQGNRPVLKSYGTGSRMGLRLTINLNQSRYIATTNYGAGIKVAVHNQADPPRADDHGIAVPVRRSAFIGVMLFTVTDKTKTNCSSTDDTSDFHFLHGEYNYSYASCRMDCYYTQIAVACGCILVETFTADDRHFKHLNHCTVMDLCCIMSQQSIGSPCKCLPSCSTLDFDLSMSYSDLLDDYVGMANPSKESKNSILTVSVYLKTLSIRREVTYFSYDFGALLADIGGQLGLFLGISAISVLKFTTWAVDKINKYILSKSSFCQSSVKDRDDHQDSDAEQQLLPQE